MRCVSRAARRCSCPGRSGTVIERLCVGGAVMRPRSLSTCVLSALLACAAVRAAEPERPDFTGLWTAYREPGQRGFSGFGGPRNDLPLTAEGKRRTEEYGKLLGPE